MRIIPKASGIFYPERKEELIEVFENTTFERKNISDLIIVPHAGYEYAINILLEAYSYLVADKNCIIVIAPAIYNKVYGTVSSGNITLETPIDDIMCESYPTEIDNRIISEESALTVQLPIIKYLFPDVTVIPVVYGCEDYKNISKIIESNIEKSAIVVVSNLSRFIPERQSNNLDEHTAYLIRNKQIHDFDAELADGAVGICGVIDYIKNKDLYLKEIIRSNSSKVNGDTSSVVGYGSWVLTNQ